MTHIIHLLSHFTEGTKPVFTRALNYLDFNFIGISEYFQVRI